MTMPFDSDDAKFLDSLSSLLEEAVSPYKLMDIAIERHGSWEWVACRPDDLNRYVIVALTEMEQGPPFPMARAYDVELWAGADDGQRYWRGLVSRFSLMTTPFFMAEEQHVQLQRLLKAAITRADSLTTADLSDSYLPPRALRKPA
jgi:hypothetical protein